MHSGIHYAPPTPSPGETSAQPSQTATQTVSPSMSKLPTTGPNDNVAAGALAIGIPAVMLGAVILALLARHRRHRTG